MGQTIGRKTAVGNYLFLRIRRAPGRGYLARWTYPHGLVWAIDEFSVNQIVRNELSCFVVRDHNGQAFAHVYYEDNPFSQATNVGKKRGRLRRVL